VIHEVDKALQIVLSSAAGAPEGLEIVFEPPNRKWAEGLNGAPTINLFLYDIREDTKQRRVGQTPVRNERGRTVGYRPPPRIYKLSYVGTAWSGTGDPEKDHEMLGWMLRVFAGMKQLPGDSLTGSLATWGMATIDVCQPTVDARPTPHSMTALGGEARPNLEIAVSAPVVEPVSDAAGLVLEELILDAQGKGGQPFERVQRRYTGGIAELEVGEPGMPTEERSRAPDASDLSSLED
jgi:hypothetical protein